MMMNVAKQMIAEHVSGKSEVIGYGTKTGA